MAKKYQARGSSLRFSVKRDGAFFVVDFFSEDGDWLEDWVVPIHGTRLANFKDLCNMRAFLIENPDFPDFL